MSNVTDDFIDLGFLKDPIINLLKQKMMLMLSLVIISSISFLIVFNSPTKYSAQMILSHNELNIFDQVSNESSIGLGDIGGFSIGDNSPLVFQKFKVLIKSYRVAELIVSDKDIIIFGDERDLSVKKVYKYLSNNIEIIKYGSGSSQFVSVIHTSKNKKLSKQLLNYVYENADILIKESQRASSINKLDYLYNKLANTQSSVIRSSLASIITQEESILSIADLDTQFASEIIDYNYYDDSGIISRSIKSLFLAVILYLVYLIIYLIIISRKIKS